MRRLRFENEDLREKIEILKKQRSSLQDAKMKYVFIYENSFDFRVTKMTKILEVKRSGYYK